jgi:hypothetical protein
MDHEWHEVLFALYGLDEVERVDDLAKNLERNDHAWDIHHAVAMAWGAKSRHLDRERDSVMRQIRGTTPGRTVDVDAFMDWPGMPNYRKPVS